MKFVPTQQLRRSLRAALLGSAIAVATLGGVATAPAWAEVPMGGYADLVEKVSPAVVYIEVTGKQSEQATTGDAQPFGDTPFGQNAPLDDFMRHFFQNNPQFGQPDAQPDQGVMHALGSGFLISADGEIVTNNHVVDGASEIKVKLSDGREFAAKVVGTDPMTDVALIKLEKASGLPFATFGASDKLRVGDAVVAVGNPFGLGGTVTSGIVSAMGRNINSGPYDSYIQTDAAINKGNSGGPLFNTAGEVVGMNTAIFSPTGGSVGIGFSVPAQTIQTVVAQLKDHGSVNRGWLGVMVQPVTDDLAQALGMGSAKGEIVGSVQPDSPAAAAKLQSGDVIVAVNGTTVDDKHGLPLLIAGIPAGDSASLSILREGKAQEVKVTIGALTPEKLQMASAEGDASGQINKTLGISVMPLAPEIASQLGLGPDEKGLVVSKVEADGPNADRLERGDVIEAAAGQPVATPADLTLALAGVKDKSNVLLQIARKGSMMFVGAVMTAS